MYTGKIYAIVRAPINEVYNFLFEIQRWVKYLPHCVDIKVEKQTSRAQIVTMQIKTNSKIDTIRTVRNFHKNKQIEFRQTTLPSIFEFHGGTWVLTKFGTQTMVTVVHNLKLKGNIFKRKLLQPIIWHFFIKRHSLTTLKMMRRYLEK